MKNLFIDSNIWLSLYHFSKDNLKEFEKLHDLLGKDIKLWLPQQVLQEVCRNRDSRLKDSYSDFGLPNLQYPNFCKAYDEYEEISKEYNCLKEKLSKWRKKIDADIENNSLFSDKLIGKFFDDFTQYSNEENIVGRAKFRYKLGNPPGKNHSIGDAINWEWLLEVVPEGENLYFVSADKDYCSAVFKDKFNSFLRDEWKEKKKSDIIFYTTLKRFLDENTETVRLHVDDEGKRKMNLLQQLAMSGSFATTHDVISIMDREISSWSTADIQCLCDVAEKNNQVGLIVDDFDVREFYKKVLVNVSYISLSEGSIKRVMEKVFRQSDDSYVIDCGTF